MRCERAEESAGRGGVSNESTSRASGVVVWAFVRAQNATGGARMYAIAILRFRRPLDEVDQHIDAHRRYLRTLAERGVLLAAGRLDPRSGGALLLRVPDDDVGKSLDAIRDDDPLVQAGVAQYELLPWLPTIGIDALNTL
jgi:uncharacterized protein YciI